MQVNEAEDGISRPQDALEHRAPLNEGPISKIGAVQRKHVEREDGD